MRHIAGTLMRPNNALLPIDRLRPFHLNGLLCGSCFLIAIVLASGGFFRIAFHSLLMGLLFATAVHYRLGWTPPMLVLGVFFGPDLLQQVHNFLDDRVPLMIMGGMLGLIIGALLNGGERIWSAKGRVCRVRDANHDEATAPVRLEDSANPTNEIVL